MTRDDLTAELRSHSRQEAFLPSEGPSPPTFLPIGLPVRETVQAGAWLLADDTGQAEPRRFPAARDPRFPNADQWLAEVRGDSMNLIGIVEGDLVHCVGADSGYSPRTGDLVEVERLRFQGAEREITLKQVEVRADQTVLLWPRSSNPRWKDPLSFRLGVPEGEEIEVRIRAHIVASIRRY